MSNITIVVPKESDVDVMVAWGKSNKELLLSDDDPWYDPETLREWIRDPQDDIILVAKDGEKLVGMCLVHTLRDFAYCSILFVIKEYRSMGIGRALLDTAGNDLKMKGIPAFGLLVEEENKDSQAFYEKIGLKKGHVFRWMDKKLI